MRKIILGLAAAILTACLSPEEAPTSGDNPTSTRIPAGTYRGDHGELTSARGMESELILNKDGSFRYFFIDSNTAFSTAKGRWNAIGSEMTWTEVIRSELYHGGFREWDTLAAPDTSYLRQITDSSFERLELSYGTQGGSAMRWVDYHRITPENPLPEGKFEFPETYRNGVDSTRIDTGLTQLEISRTGPYIQRVFRNGDTTMTDVDSLWIQSGTFLITTRNRHCEYEPGYTACGDAPPGYEYVVRLGHVTDTAFYLWMGRDFTLQPEPFWAVFRKTE